jgi:hypothetical protein
MCELCNGNGIALPRFVVNRDVALEFLVAQPLHSREVLDLIRDLRHTR